VWYKFGRNVEVMHTFGDCFIKINVYYVLNYVLRYYLCIYFYGFFLCVLHAYSYYYCI
jgi:hypothetical protein